MWIRRYFLVEEADYEFGWLDKSIERATEECLIRTYGLNNKFDEIQTHTRLVNLELKKCTRSSDI